MLNIDAMNLKSFFSDKHEYNEFKKWLILFFNRLRANYQFLKLSNEKWEEIFIKSIKFTFQENASQEYFKQNISWFASNLIRIENNIFLAKNINSIYILLNQAIKRGTNARKKLTLFYEYLKSYNIVMSYELFSKLNTNPQFLNLLQALNLVGISKNELNLYLTNQNLYSLLKPFNMDYNTAKKQINYILNILDIDLMTILNINYEESSLANQIKLIMNSERIVNMIYQKYIQIYGEVSRQEFDKILFNFPYKRLEELFTKVFKDDNYDNELKMLNYYLANNPFNQLETVSLALESYIQNMFAIPSTYAVEILKQILNHLSYDSQINIIKFINELNPIYYEEIKNIKAIYNLYFTNPIFNIWFSVLARYNIHFINILPISKEQSILRKLIKFLINNPMDYENVKNQILEDLIYKVNDFEELMDLYLEHFDYNLCNQNQLKK